MLTDVWFWISAVIVAVTVGVLVFPLLDAAATWWTERRTDDVSDLLARERRGPYTRGTWR